MIYNYIRPNKINKLYGKHLDPIREDIENNNIARTYLFYGPRGTGKTSTARILANHIDNPFVIEVNVAADSTKKDAEKLISGLSSLPIGFHSKLVILDEIHKASPGFQNAILSPAETHPKGVYFIFCTTEIDKVVTTIKSRCKKIPFNVLSKDEIRQVLSDGRKACSVTTELPDSVVALIYRKSEGCARDALTELELISYTDVEEEMLSRLNVVKTQAKPKVIKLFDCLYGDVGWKETMRCATTLKDENPEGVRRILLSIAKNELNNSYIEDEDVLFLYRIISTFNKKCYENNMDLVEACLEYYFGGKK